MKRSLRTPLLGGCLLGFVLLFGGGTLLFFRTWPDLSMEKLVSCEGSAVAVDTRGRLLRVWPSPLGDWSLPISLDQMGSWLPQVAVAVEDRRFHSHKGVDIVALMRAVFQNFRARRVVSGGSTITSQVVRLSYPRPRTFRAKLDEFRQALEAERHLSKSAILELYLNKACFGGMLRGVEAASWGWFGKPASTLSLGESALLVGLLKGPTAYRPDRHPARAKARRDSILKLLRQRGIIDASLLARALEEPLPEKMRPFPVMAPLCLDNLHKEHPEKKRLRVTLDRTIQEKLHRICLGHMKSFGSNVTMAALVVENATGKIRAWLGNIRWGSGALGSWIDCVRTFRSPGSALKPFAYAQAFQRGYLTPDSLMADTPYGFGGQHPRNFDRTFRGPVSARDALTLSLNVPAVRVLRMVGGASFLSLLQRLGFSRLTRKVAHYGDSLILGGCEVSLEELVRAYTVFPEKGLLRSLSLLETSLPTWKDRVLSPGAAFLTTLSLARPKGLSRQTQLLLRQRRVDLALKTGTSYAMRDGWTVAFTPEYTLGVWVGDPGGSPLQGVVGIRAAAPSAVETLLALTGDPAPLFIPPEEVSRRKICVLSGAPPGEACPGTTMGWYVPGVSPGKACTIHKKEGNRVVMEWPRALEGYERGGIITEPPGALGIVAPLPGGEIRFSSSREKIPKIPLLAEGGRLPLYWYVDGIYVGREDVEAQPCFWPLKPGKHVLSVVDREGRAARTDFTVAEDEEL